MSSSVSRSRPLEKPSNVPRRDWSSSQIRRSKRSSSMSRTLKHYCRSKSIRWLSAGQGTDPRLPARCVYQTFLSVMIVIIPYAWSLPLLLFPNSMCTWIQSLLMCRWMRPPAKLQSGQMRLWYQNQWRTTLVTTSQTALTFWTSSVLIMVTAHVDTKGPLKYSAEKGPEKVNASSSIYRPSTLRYL